MLLRETSPQAYCRDQGFQRRAVKFLGKTQYNFFSPDKAILLRCRRKAAKLTNEALSGQRSDGRVQMAQRSSSLARM